MLMYQEMKQQVIIVDVKKKSVKRNMQQIVGGKSHQNLYFLCFFFYTLKIPSIINLFIYLFFLYFLRSNSRDKTRVNSRDRQNNQQNRENDNYNNNNQKNNSNSRRYDHRRHRNIIQRSRESSKDRNYRGGNRNFDDLHRHRYK